MPVETQNLRERFLRCDEGISACFLEERTLLPHLGAFLLAAVEKEPALEELRAARELARLTEAHMGPTTEQYEPLLTALAAASEAPERTLLAVDTAFAALKEHFFPSPYLLPAACALVFFCGEEQDTDAAAMRAGAVYRAVEERYPLLVCSEDVPACVALSLVPGTPEELAERVAQCMERIGSATRRRNAAQALSCILALWEDSESACARTLGILRTLRQMGARPDNAYLAAAVGAVGPSGSPERAALAVLETEKCLRRSTSLGWFRLPRRQRLALACLLMSGEDGGEERTQHLAAAASLLTLAALCTEDDLSALLPRR